MAAKMAKIGGKMCTGYIMTVGKVSTTTTSPRRHLQMEILSRSFLFRAVYCYVKLCICEQ